MFLLRHIARARARVRVPAALPCSRAGLNTARATAPILAGPRGLGAGLAAPQQRQHLLAARAASSIPGGSPLERYARLKRDGAINEDPRQEVAMVKLDDLCHRIANYAPTARSAASVPRQTPAASGGGGGGGFLSGLFGGGGKKQEVKKAAAEPPAPKPTGPIGLYLWGGTGTGKTFMMDIFHDAAPVVKKRRIHFHEWLIDVHGRLHRLQKNRQNAASSADDLVAQVATEMMDEAWLLCFDEFQVTHISDAIIMKRIFSVLWERGAVVVATSNRPPEDLYKNGLNRPLFLPFIPMIKDFCEVHDIGADVDYRLISSPDGDEDMRVYLTPNTDKENAVLEKKFARICSGHVLLHEAQVEAQGRRIQVPRAAMNSSVAWFSFKDLCDKPLGAADYLAVASAFHTVFIADVPKLTLQERDQVRRFITLIDALYDSHTKVVCTAERDPITLFEVTEEDKQTSTFDEVFAWDRTVSRLTEMQSAKYLSEAVRRLDADQFYGQFTLKSLTDEDMRHMWMRYDVDDSDELDMKELRPMLEDLLERQQGHRNLSDEAFEACTAVIDTNKDGKISFEEFQQYLGDYNVVETSLSGK